jgi:hypothetical protein
MLFQSDKKNFTKAKGGAETKIPEEAILEAWAYFRKMHAVTPRIKEQFHFSYQHEKR